MAIIIFHNHPFGKSIPSEADRQITSKIIQAEKLLDILVMDHLIITPESYYSSADNGEMR